MLAISTVSSIIQYIQTIKMEFTTNQIEHLIDCLNFYYSENDDIKLDIVQVNSECAKKLYAEQETRLQKQWAKPTPEWQ